MVEGAQAKEGGTDFKAAVSYRKGRKSEGEGRTLCYRKGADSKALLSSNYRKYIAEI
jgi:hypothetical protein